MARIANFFDGKFEGPVSGSYAFYRAGVTSPTDADKVNTYPTYDDALAQTNANANPVTLNAAGRPTSGGGIWLREAVKVKAYDADGVLLWTQDDINADPLLTEDALQDSLIENGSFENWTTGEPDHITVTAYTGATFSQDSADSYHGGSSLKVIGNSNGGAEIVFDGGSGPDEYFTVSPGQEILVEFFLKCADANCKNIVKVLWYTNNTGTPSATPSSDIYNEGAANPTSWARKSGFATPPSDARFGRLAATIIDPSGTTKATTVRLDGVRVVPSTWIVNSLRATDVLDSAGTGPVPLSQGALVGGSKSDKAIKFNPSGANSTVVPFKVVGYAKGRTNSNTLYFYGGIITGYNSHAAGSQTLNNTARATQKLLALITADIGVIVGANNLATANIFISTVDAAGAAVTSDYHLLIVEFD